MRESILRVIDDLETKYSTAADVEKETNNSKDKAGTLQNMYASGAAAGIAYAIVELRKVINDHGKS